MIDVIANTDMLELLVSALAIAALFAMLVWSMLSQTAQSKGELGERMVSTGISHFLDETEYQLIDNATFYSGYSTTQIDHLIVSPYGIFVIETKHMTGWIFGDPNQALWTQVIFRLKYKFQNPLTQNLKHIKAVQAIFGLKPRQVHSVVVFVGDCTLKTQMPPQVVKGIPQLVDFIKSKRVRVFTESYTLYLVEKILNKRMAPDKKTEHLHIRNVKAKALYCADKTSVACPRCGDSMVERTNKRTGQRFLGCLRFPDCNGVRSLP